MANKLDPMDLKQILLLYNDGVSNRQIGELLSISRNTVNNYIKLARASDYSTKESLAGYHRNIELNNSISNFDELIRFIVSQKIDLFADKNSTDFDFNYIIPKLPQSKERRMKV